MVCEDLVMELAGEAGITSTGHVGCGASSAPSAAALRPERVAAAKANCLLEAVPVGKACGGAGAPQGPELAVDAAGGSVQKSESRGLAAQLALLTAAVPAALPMAQAGVAATLHRSRHHQQRLWREQQGWRQVEEVAVTARAGTEPAAQVKVAAASSAAASVAEEEPPEDESELEEAEAEHDREQDTRKPLFHVMPLSGWGSDPNGPIFYKGRYHLFYQSRPGTCQWHWGVGWDHVVSSDLAHWTRLPPAIFPSSGPGGADADGCFSGSILVEPHTGVPVCFYTGARLRPEAAAAVAAKLAAAQQAAAGLVLHQAAGQGSGGSSDCDAEGGGSDASEAAGVGAPPVLLLLPPPPAEHDMGLPHYEAQCCAICDPDDDLLVRWRKVPMPLMQLPPSGQLTAWRDPWFVEHGDGRGRQWTMLIGSGLKGGGGTALVYRSADITRGWRYVGELCSRGDPRLGAVWECPFLVQLQPLPLCAHVLPTTDLAAVAGAAAEATAVAEALCAHVLPATELLRADAPQAAERATTPGLEASGMEARGSSGIAGTESPPASMPPPLLRRRVLRSHHPQCAQDQQGSGGGAAAAAADSLPQAHGSSGSSRHRRNSDDERQPPPVQREQQHSQPAGSWDVGSGASDGTAAGSAAAAGSASQLSDGGSRLPPVQPPRPAAAAAPTAPPRPASPLSPATSVPLAALTGSGRLSDLLLNLTLAQEQPKPQRQQQLRHRLEQQRRRSQCQGNIGGHSGAGTAAAAAAAADPHNEGSEGEGSGSGSSGSSARYGGCSRVDEDVSESGDEGVAQVCGWGPAAAGAADDSGGSVDASYGNRYGAPGDGTCHQRGYESHASGCSSSGGDCATAAASSYRSSAGSSSMAGAGSGICYGAGPALLADAVRRTSVHRRRQRPTDLQGLDEPEVAEVQEEQEELHAVHPTALLPSPAAGPPAAAAPPSAAATATPAAAAAAAAVAAAAAIAGLGVLLPDLPAMIAEVVRARRAIPGAVECSATASPPALAAVAAVCCSGGGRSGATAPTAAASASPPQPPAAEPRVLLYSPGRIGHCAAPDAPVAVEPLQPPPPPPPLPLCSGGNAAAAGNGSADAGPAFAMRMRYCKAQPLPHQPHLHEPAPAAAAAGAEAPAAEALPTAAAATTGSAACTAALPSPIAAGASSAAPPGPPVAAPLLAPVAKPPAAPAAATTTVHMHANSSASTAPAATPADHDHSHSHAQSYSPHPPHYHQPNHHQQQQHPGAPHARPHCHHCGCSHCPHADVESASSHAHAATLPPHARWLFGTAPDACYITGGLVGTRPIFWIGSYDAGAARFDLDRASVAAPLDLGNVLYAPSCMRDPQGRHIVWGYMKELREVPPAPALCDKYSYAGCVSLPRALYLRGDKLFQVPLPELTSLRSDVAVHVSALGLAPGGHWRLSGVRGLHLDMELAISPGRSRRVVVLFRSWRPRGRGAAALVYEWRTRRLFVVFEALSPAGRRKWSGGGGEGEEHRREGEQQGADKDTAAQVASSGGGGGGGSDAGSRRRCGPGGVEDWLWERRDEAGGELDLPPGCPLRLRLFLDASCLEVFTGTGQALTTRIYRGHPPPWNAPCCGGGAAAAGVCAPVAAPATAGNTGPAFSPAPDPGIEIWAVGDDGDGGEAAAAATANGAGSSSGGGSSTTSGSSRHVGCTLDDVHVYEMSSGWMREQDVPKDGFVHR